MNITPKAGPSIIKPITASTTNNSEARDRAIAVMTKGMPEAPKPPAVSPAEAFKTLNQTTSSNNSEISEERSVQQTPGDAKEATSKPAEEPLSKHYANLARKERALRVQAQRLQAEREAFKASQAATKPIEVDTSKFIDRERLLQDPFAVLNELGVSYDQLTNSALNQPKPEEIAYKKLENDLRQELKSVKEAQEKAARDAEQQQTQSYQQAVNQIRNDAKQLVNSDPDTYEAIRSTGSINDVVELIEETFKQDGVLLSVEDAAREVEEYLAEEAFKLSQLKKIQNRMRANAPKPAPAQSLQTEKPQAGLKTLTNAISSTRQMSARERAIAAFKGEKS